MAFVVTFTPVPILDAIVAAMLIVGGHVGDWSESLRCFEGAPGVGMQYQRFASWS